MHSKSKRGEALKAAVRRQRGLLALHGVCRGRREVEAAMVLGVEMMAGVRVRVAAAEGAAESAAGPGGDNGIGGVQWCSRCSMHQ